MLESGYETITITRHTSDSNYFEQQTSLRFIIHGYSKNFVCQLFIPNRPEKIKLKSKKFGLVYQTEGEIGNRVFQVKRYELPTKMKDGEPCIQLRTEGNETKVFLVIEEGANGDEKPLDEVESKTYRESERTGGKTSQNYLPLGGSIPNILEIAKFFSSFIGL